MNEKAAPKQPTAVMCFSGGDGGMERSAARLARLLSDITQVSFFYKQGAPAQRLISDTDNAVRCIPIKFRSRAFSPAMLFAVRRSIIRYGIRNVIFLGASELKTLHFCFLGLDINLTVWHGTTKNHPKRDPLHRLVYSNVAHHVTISGHLLKNVQQIVPLTPGVDFKLILPSQSIQAGTINTDAHQDDTINILHLGRIADGKGQLDAIIATEKMVEAGLNCRLTIIGENDGNPYAKRVDQAIDNSFCGDAIHAPGFVDDIYAYFRAADIFLFPSRGEGMPGVIVEALHFPLVCLTYDNTVFPEFATMGFHFHTVEDGNVGQLGHRLQQICANLEGERLQAKRNPELARTIFNRQRERAEWLEVLV